MCKVHPQVKDRLSPCTRRLVSADSSPLTVVGRINLNVVFPGLQCNMCCVVANIGLDGLLGTEALQSCLPHQLDLRTGQLWAEGRATLQLHQQKPTPDVNGLLLTAVVLPPDNEVMASFSINGGHLGSCALIDPNRDLTEEFGVVVGHTLVDASTPSANVLIINPNTEEVVLQYYRTIWRTLLRGRILPWVLVTKKDGSTRFCVDYRRLYSLTVKDAYPLPRIDDSLRLLGNQQWFSTMDLASGYWQVAMSPEAKRKAAFVTNEGLFQFRVMPMHQLHSND